MSSSVEERLESPALDLTFHLAPWDRPAFPCNTATISSIRLAGSDTDDDGSRVFDAFRSWCADHDVGLVSCRLPQDRLRECAFLESRGFRFVELYYRPFVNDLAAYRDDPEIEIKPALLSDVEEIAWFVEQNFSTGRYHADPMIGADIGNRRYAGWFANAVEHPTQRVLKYFIRGQMFAAFVLGRLPPVGAFTLVCLAPGLKGQGLGQRCMKTTLALHHREGFERVAAGVSSLNVASMNMLIASGFRFPAPEITLHWCPFGPVWRS